ncbi:MAG TPA: NAD/NADP octopine/nopaline dehydrogenase family protein, partial [Steroidobacteraceae bacterium]|nr:NAD/NADP octopine/nopaline dehydrogenase family protein [Steroidobacteraceae bacterium]
GRVVPPTVELSTLTYVARKPSADRVVTTGRARSVRAAPLPGGADALRAARALYESIVPTANVLATSLSNVNLVLHPPGAVLGAAWIEATKGEFTFYVQGLTDGVARVMERLDAERRAVARALGQHLPSLFDEMRAIGTIESCAEERAGLAAAIRGGVANRRILAPDSLRHRYFHEDFWYGLKPFLSFAEIARVDVPVAQALWQLGETLVGPDAPHGGGRSAAQMGIAGMSGPELVRSVTEAA